MAKLSTSSSRGAENRINLADDVSIQQSKMIIIDTPAADGGNRWTICSQAFYSAGHPSPNMADTLRRRSAEAISTLWRCNYLLRLLSYPGSSGWACPQRYWTSWINESIEEVLKIYPVSSMAKLSTCSSRGSRKSNRVSQRSAWNKMVP
jgi:hypothetical protein